MLNLWCIYILEMVRAWEKGDHTQGGGCRGRQECVPLQPCKAEYRGDAEHNKQQNNNN